MWMVATWLASAMGGRVCGESLVWYRWGGGKVFTLGGTARRCESGRRRAGAATLGDDRTGVEAVGRVVVGLARVGEVGTGAAVWKMAASCWRASSWAWPQLAQAAAGAGF